MLRRWLITSLPCTATPGLAARGMHGQYLHDMVNREVALKDKACAGTRIRFSFRTYLFFYYLGAV